MAPTALTPTLRYFPPGTRKVYWFTSCTNYNSPTRGELDAGKDLTAEIASMDGWSVTSDTVDTPDLGTTFTSQIGGRTSAAGSSITFYLSSNSSDVRSLLPRNTAGYVAILWEGDVAAQKMDVYPVKVTTQANDTTVDDPGQTTISFSVTKVPAAYISIPA